MTSTRVKVNGRTGGPELRLGFNHTGCGTVYDALLQQAHKYNRRVAHAHLAVELRRVFALYSFVPPEQLLWRQSHRAPQNTKFSCLCSQSYSSPPRKLILQSITDLFLACSSRPTTLILRCLVLSGLLKLPHAASFFVLEIPLGLCTPLYH